MAADKEKSAAAVEHLKQVILASKKLGVGMVTTIYRKGPDQKCTGEPGTGKRDLWPADH